MATNAMVDAQGILRTVDTETNLNRTAYGAEDLDDSDYLETTGNGASRQLEIAAKNDGESNVSLVLAAKGSGTIVLSSALTSLTTVNINSPILQTLSGTGYSLNLITVTSTSANTRALRVNLTTSAGIASGDLQCVHGYLTLGSQATIANNAAIYPLSAWLDLPDSLTVGTGTVIAGLRVIVDANNNTLGSATAGCECARFIYGQTWASAGTIDAGLFMSAGAGTTIDSAIELAGTFGQIITLDSWPPNTLMHLVSGGPMDATATQRFGIFVGDSTTHATIHAEVGACSYGSLYASTVGELWVKDSGGTWLQVTAT